MAEALAHMDDGIATLPDEPADPLPTTLAPGPRLGRGTSERTVAEVRAMLAASIAAVPAPQIVIIAPRPKLSRTG